MKKNELAQYRDAAFERFAQACEQHQAIKVAVVRRLPAGCLVVPAAAAAAAADASAADVSSDVLLNVLASNELVLGSQLHRQLCAYLQAHGQALERPFQPIFKRRPFRRPQHVSRPLGEEEEEEEGLEGSAAAMDTAAGSGGGATPNLSKHYREEKKRELKCWKDQLLGLENLIDSAQAALLELLQSSPSSSTVATSMDLSRTASGASTQPPMSSPAASAPASPASSSASPFSSSIPVPRPSATTTIHSDDCPSSPALGKKTLAAAISASYGAAAAAMPPSVQLAAATVPQQPAA